MVFTDNPVLVELGGQINRLLIDRQKIRADVKREEISSKKMLANISHDIKTPLTVILGYLEIESIADTVGVIHHGKMMKEISMKDIAETNTAYIELAVEDTKKAAYVSYENFIRNEVMLFGVA